MVQPLFPTDLPSLEWQELPADGFISPACGLIHRKDSPARNGMPLGSIDTGCIDLETDGTLGYCTIFNSHVPRRGPLNLPFLGLCLHNKGQACESWMLSTRALHPDPLPGPFTTPFRPKRAHPAEEIHYWGHYPIVDLEYGLDCPVSVGMRAWAPFIPGDVALSNTPGAVFEVRLRNTSETPQAGMIAFSFPGPSAEESAGHGRFQHINVSGPFRGVVVTNDLNQEYALGIVNEDVELRLGGDLGCDGGAWSRLDTESRNISGTGPSTLLGLPPALDQPGASAAVRFGLQPGEEKSVRFILAWYSPTWQGGGQTMLGGHTYYHKYAERYKSAYEVAAFLAANHAQLLARIVAWQQVVYAETALPVWLRESLVNNLHLITEDGFWGQARPPIGEWCRKEDGLFGMNECPRGCPQIECIPCSFYGNIPLVYFFPELALSTLRAYKAYQYPDGAAPWIFGGVTGAALRAGDAEQRVRPQAPDHARRAVLCGYDRTPVAAHRRQEPAARILRFDEAEYPLHHEPEARSRTGGDRQYPYGQPGAGLDGELRPVRHRAAHRRRAPGEPAHGGAYGAGSRRRSLRPAVRRVVPAGQPGAGREDLDRQRLSALP